MIGRQTETRRPLDWVGSSRKDFDQFPREVQRDIGAALRVAQLGGKHATAKPWKGSGPGVLEVVENFDGDTYRAVYTVRFHGFIYVLHAFQKKSTSGIRTARTDVEMIERRLRVAHDDYRNRSGTP